MHTNICRLFYSTGIKSTLLKRKRMYAYTNIFSFVQLSIHKAVTIYRSFQNSSSFKSRVILLAYDMHFSCFIIIMLLACSIQYIHVYELPHSVQIPSSWKTNKLWTNEIAIDLNKTLFFYGYPFV